MIPRFFIALTLYLHNLLKYEARYVIKSLSLRRLSEVRSRCVNMSGPEINRGDGADVPPAAGNPGHVGPIGTQPRYRGTPRNRRRLGLGAPWLRALGIGAVVAVVGYVGWNMLGDSEPDTLRYIDNKDGYMASLGTQIGSSVQRGDRTFQLFRQDWATGSFLTVAVTHNNEAAEYTPPTDAEIQSIFGSRLGGLEITNIVGFTPFYSGNNSLSKYEIFTQFGYSQLQDTGYRHNHYSYGDRVKSHITAFMNSAGNNQQVINCSYDDGNVGTEYFSMYWRGQRPAALDDKAHLDELAFWHNPENDDGYKLNHPLSRIRGPSDACPNTFEGRVSHFLPKHYP